MQIADHLDISGLIAYSEATRFTKEKYAQTVKWCLANDKPIPRHTLYPRTRGFIATVKALRSAPQVKAVYDVTIAYARGKQFMVAPSFFDTIYQPRLDRTWKMYVHVIRHDLASLPETDGELAVWLESRWMEKGERLESLRSQLHRGQEWTVDDAASTLK